MKKIFKIFFTIITLLFILTGCSNNENEAAQLYTLNDLKNDLTVIDSTLKINKKAATLIGAVEGYGFIMNDCAMEVYKFDKYGSEYKKALQDQKLTMPDFEMTFSATIRNGYGYVIIAGSCGQAIPYLEKLYQ